MDKGLMEEMVLTVLQVYCGVILEGVWRIFSNGSGIGMVGGLCVWVEIEEYVFVLMTAFG